MTSEPAAEDPDEALGRTVTELYALLPGEFTAARNQRAAAAGKAGRKEHAQRLKALPKPSAAAWLVNMLARHRHDEMEGVLELGAALREAQEDLDPQEMRRLSSERQRLLRAMARDAQQLAAKLGHPVSSAAVAEAEQTLWAAMTDADAAAAVSSGQLVRPLTASGWGSVELDGAVAVPGLVSTSAPGATTGGTHGRRSDTAADERPGPKERASARSAEEKRRRAQRSRALRAARAELDEAEQLAAQAEQEFASLQTEVDELTVERDAVADDLEDLREQLRRLEQELSGLDRRAGSLERRRDTARRAARAAGRARDRLRHRVEDLAATEDLAGTTEK